MMRNRVSLLACSFTLPTEFHPMVQPHHPSLPWSAFHLLEQRQMPASCEAIADILAWLEAVGEQQQWAMKQVFALSLSADEALTNIATHAIVPAGGPLQIWLSLGLMDDGPALCIADNGEAFDPTAKASAALVDSLDEAQAGGHGLRLMRHYLQRFEYQRVDGWNCLLMGVTDRSSAG